MRTIFSKLLIFLVIFTLGIGIGYSYIGGGKSKTVSVENKQSPYITFLSEIYDKIKLNYWDNISDIQLMDLFRLSASKFLGPNASITTKRDDLFKSMKLHG